ncbi:MAG TPA: hypothetical protein VF317_11385, partial [Dermatophilaceae bacterium]
MPGAQVAAVDYAPAGWPVGTRMIVRRMKVKAAAISTDRRARRRRTFDPAQLALALGGQLDHAYAYSPIVTNLSGPAVPIEAWFRDRAWVEERIKDSKLGMALRHLPSGYAAEASQAASRLGESQSSLSWVSNRCRKRRLIGLSRSANSPTAAGKAVCR